MASDPKQPAFPTKALYEREKGMTLCDWFAGQALAGFAASPLANSRDWIDSNIAKHCYDTADAMFAEKDRRDAVVRTEQNQ